MKNDILISIIVPVYNVDKYLSQCLNSLIISNMEEIEIILVDDGSTDRSGIICDEFANKYSFINVIHKRNEGLSSARNDGIKSARGKWISLIDSDDLVVKGYLNIIKKIVHYSNYDIFMFKHRNFEDKYGCFPSKLFFDKTKLFSLSKDKAMLSLITNTFGNYAWNKIYNKKLFQTIKYPVGKGYEDIYTTYLLYAEASKIAVYDEQLYFYRQRSTSIVYESEINKKVKFFKDRYDALKRQSIFFKENYPYVYKKDKSNVVKAALILTTYVEIFNQPKDDIYKSALELILNCKLSIRQLGFKNIFLVEGRRHLKNIYLYSIKILLKDKVKYKK